MSFLISVIFLIFLGGPAPALDPGAAGAAAPRKMRVVASIIPLGDFCQKIGGDLVEVQVLIPPGASPHVFEPPPSVVAKVIQAQVMVYIGAGLEPWADKLLAARGTAGLTVVEAAAGLPLLEMGAPRHFQGKGTEPQGKGRPPAAPTGAAPGPEVHSHGTGNPHIWLDPVLAQEICRKIAGAFMQADPARGARYEENLKHYLAALQELDREIQQQVDTWRIRDFVSFHAAFSYFARRYQLHEAGVIETAPGREPTPRHIREIVGAIRRYGILVVFAEPQLSPRIAEVIAQEAGAKVLLLDPVGGQPPYGSDYLQLMRYNLATMAQAMK